ncbi:MAG: hypothetical protein IKT33_02595 [Clostridia bacterium]|nr:hypothetical protein [Clostridia bacterium]
MRKSVISHMFNTNAMKVSPYNKPFNYRTGFGPYIYQAQYLFGGEDAANEILEIISEYRNNPIQLIQILSDKINLQYQQNESYKDTINYLKKYIESTVNIKNIDIISGGERRDWFFSLLLAQLFNKPHLTIFKNGNMYVNDNSHPVTKQNMTGVRALHITDNLVKAKSFNNAWIPFTKQLGITITDAVSVFDRCNIGHHILEENKINHKALFSVNSNLFGEFLMEGHINEKQYKLLCLFSLDEQKYRENINQIISEIERC